VVHARTVGDSVLTFVVSGKLWRTSLIMEDNETGSLWSHVTGEALDGPMKGKKLRVLPSAHTTWRAWVKEHPDTKVLRKGREIRSSRYGRYFKDPDRNGMFRTNWLRGRMPGKALVQGITRGPYSVAIPDKKLQEGEILNARLGDDPVVVLRAADGGVKAYLSTVGENRLSFERGDRPGEMRDRKTGSVWDTGTGRCISGAFKGEALEELVVREAFWFAWSTFFPRTEVVD